MATAVSLLLLVVVIQCLVLITAVNAKTNSIPVVTSHQRTSHRYTPLSDGVSFINETSERELGFKLNLTSPLSPNQDVLITLGCWWTDPYIDTNAASCYSYISFDPTMYNAARLYCQPGPQHQIATCRLPSYYNLKSNNITLYVLVSFLHGSIENETASSFINITMTAETQLPTKVIEGQSFTAPLKIWFLTAGQRCYWAPFVFNIDPSAVTDASTFTFTYTGPSQFTNDTNGNWADVAYFPITDNYGRANSFLPSATGTGWPPTDPYYQVNSAYTAQGFIVDLSIFQSYCSNSSDFYGVYYTCGGFSDIPANDTELPIELSGIFSLTSPEEVYQVYPNDTTPTLVELPQSDLVSYSYVQIETAGTGDGYVTVMLDYHEGSENASLYMEFDEFVMSCYVGMTQPNTTYISSLRRNQFTSKNYTNAPFVVYYASGTGPYPPVTYFYLTLFNYTVVPPTTIVNSYPASFVSRLTIPEFTTRYSLIRQSNAPSSNVTINATICLDQETLPRSTNLLISYDGRYLSFSQKLPYVPYQRGSVLQYCFSVNLKYELKKSHPLNVTTTLTSVPLQYEGSIPVSLEFTVEYH